MTTIDPTIQSPAAQAPTLTTPSTDGAPAAANGLSVASLVLSILSIPLGQGVLAVVGIVLGFVARRREPAAVTTANWGIVVGFVALFGWLVLALFGLISVLPWFAIAIAESGVVVG